MLYPNDAMKHENPLMTDGFNLNKTTSSGSTVKLPVCDLGLNAGRAKYSKVWNRITIMLRIRFILLRCLAFVITSTIVPSKHCSVHQKNLARV